MARGIMKHGPIKTFFTRGILGGLFRPILYSKVDKINYDFVRVITETIEVIDKKIPNQYNMALQIWLSMAPLEHFGLLFLPDENNEILIPMLEKAEVNSGRECAYLTQGFMLFYLEQFIKNSPDFREKTTMTLKDIDDMCDLFFGEGNKTRKYLDYFRNLFDRSQIDFRDEPIMYVYESTKLFIHDKERQRLAIQKWDDDVISKYGFIAGFGEFINIQKDNCLKMIN